MKTFEQWPLPIDCLAESGFFNSGEYCTIYIYILCFVNVTATIIRQKIQVTLLLLLQAQDASYPAITVD